MPAAPGFYAGNALIAHPFVADPPPTMTFPGGPAPLPPGTIVDFAADVAPEAGYRASANATRLAAVSRSAGVLTFEFAADAAGMVGSRLRFRVAESDGPWTTVAAESDEEAGGCDGEPLWRGVLAVGDLGPLLALVPPGGSASGGPAVEPTRVKAATATLRAVSVGNYTRVAVGPDGGTLLRTVDVAARCLAGDVRLLPGFNVALRQDPTARSIAVDAAVGAGDGTPCAEVPTRPDEEPPEGSPFLSGGPSCRDVVTSISGVEGRAIRVQAGPGVTISVDPDDPHRLLVDVAAAGAAGCEGG